MNFLKILKSNKIVTGHPLDEMQGANDEQAEAYKRYVGVKRRGRQRSRSPRGDQLQKIKIGKKNLQKGQLAIEMVLIIVTLLALALFVSREIRNRNLIGKLISGPWKQISGVMATGNWKDPEEAMESNLHPHVNGVSRAGDH